MEARGPTLLRLRHSPLRAGDGMEGPRRRRRGIDASLAVVAGCRGAAPRGLAPAGERRRGDGGLSLWMEESVRGEVRSVLMTADAMGGVWTFAGGVCAGLGRRG